MTVTLAQRNLDGLCDLIGLGLPCSKTDEGDLVAGVEGGGLPGDVSIKHKQASVVIMYLLGPVSRHCGGM